MTCSRLHSKSVFPDTFICPELHPCPQTSQLQIKSLSVRPCGLAQGLFAEVVLSGLPALLALYEVQPRYGLGLQACFHFGAVKTVQRAAHSKWDSGTAARWQGRLGPRCIFPYSRLEIISTG